jgi:hypothetical protein
MLIFFLTLVAFSLLLPTFLLLSDILVIILAVQVELLPPLH